MTRECALVIFLYHVSMLWKLLHIVYIKVIIGIMLRCHIIAL